METTTRSSPLHETSKNMMNIPQISSSTTSPTSCSTINGRCNGSSIPQIQNPPLSPLPIPRSDSNPYPTTFVQADTSTFKQVVQMLTGSTETAKQASSPRPSLQDPPLTNNTSKSFLIPPIKTTTPKKQSSSFKLYERRHNYNLKHSLIINTLMTASSSSSSSSSAHTPATAVNYSASVNPGFSPRKPEILSPSLLDFPKLVLSPVTPLNEDPFNKSSPSTVGNSSEEERAIAEKGFYFHPSPMSTPRDSEPQLLPLFPLTSPRVLGSSS